MALDVILSMCILCLKRTLKGVIICRHSLAVRIVICVIYSKRGIITMLYTYRSCLSETRLLHNMLQHTEISFLHWLMIKVRDLFRLIHTPRYRTDERGRVGVRVIDEDPVLKVIGMGFKIPLESACMESLAVVIKMAFPSLTRILVKEKNSLETVRISFIFSFESESQLVSSI